MNSSSYVLATVFWSCKNNPNDLDEEVHTTLERLFTAWADERKADLYARISEVVKPNMTFNQLEESIQRCIDTNEKWYYA